MKIGIIGPKFSGEKIKDDLKHIAPNVHTKLYIRESALQAIEVIEQCELECDAVLFSGRGVYNSVLQRYQPKIPYDYVSKGSTSLICTFLAMEKENLPIDYFSIDGIELEVISDVFSELQIHPNNIFFYPLQSYDEQIYIDWHESLLKENKIKVILTVFVKVYHYFSAKGFPVFYLPVTRSLVRISYERLKNQLALHQAQYAQISVELLKVSVSLENAENYYSNMKKQCNIASYIVEYAQNVQGSFSAQGHYEYMIFASKGCIHNQKNYEFLYKLQTKLARAGFHLYAGIGLGITSYQAESNARKALNCSIENKETGIYLIDENEILYGPLGQNKQLSYSYSFSLFSEKEMTELAKQLSISPIFIKKIVSMIEVRKNNIFDAVELADCLHLSVRSARRILNKLVNAGYGTICAKEGNSGVGRPKNLIKIDFGIEKK